jgi:hypothetical protein
METHFTSSASLVHHGETSLEAAEVVFTMLLNWIWTSSIYERRSCPQCHIWEFQLSHSKLPTSSEVFNPNSPCKRSRRCSLADIRRLWPHGILSQLAMNRKLIIVKFDNLACGLLNAKAWRIHTWSRSAIDVWIAFLWYDLSSLTKRRVRTISWDTAMMGE